MSGVYVHIPFCRQACIYCNFYFKAGNKQAESITDAILQEIDLKLRTPGFKLETIYFGGGTPSFVDPQLIEKIIEKIKLKCNTEHLLEITLEANPDDMHKETLKAWKDAGVNRLSVGVQSFYDAHLKWMNRAHSAAEAEHALNLASSLGFELSLDLIFGIPGCSDQQWIENLEKACSYNIVHLSCYGLTLEENTPWKKLIDRNKAALPNEGLSSQQFELCMDFLKSKGWQHYEISNYCKPGKMALHNTSYWQNKPYIGIGPSAHSYDGDTRSWNVSDNNAYIESISKGIVPETVERLSPENKFNEYIMTSLRTLWGIEKEKLDALELKNDKLDMKMQAYLDAGQIIIENGAYKLTDSGKQFADGIASSLFL